MVRLNFEQMTKNEIVKLKLLAKTNDFIIFNIKTPRIAVIGSGGGFRAMVGMSGVVKALADSKILDCVTFMGGLSGSSW